MNNSTNINKTVEQKLGLSNRGLNNSNWLNKILYLKWALLSS